MLLASILRIKLLSTESSFRLTAVENDGMWNCRLRCPRRRDPISICRFELIASLDVSVMCLGHGGRCASLAGCVSVRTTSFSRPYRSPTRFAACGPPGDTLIKPSRGLAAAAAAGFVYARLSFWRHSLCSRRVPSPGCVISHLRFSPPSLTSRRQPTTP